MNDFLEPSPPNSRPDFELLAHHSSKSPQPTPEQQDQLRSQLYQKYHPSLSPSIHYDLYPQVLGAGVSAQVTKVRLQSGEDAVVKKYITRSRTVPTALLLGLDYELDILRQLNHPNILSPIGVNCSDANLEVFYPFCESNLSLLQIDTNDHATCATIANQLLSAVFYLHQHQIVHSDIKPENVLVVSVNPLRIALADFGSAVDLKKATHHSMSGFTEQYCSPLLACTSKPSFGSDLYAAGLTLMRLFTSSSPWPVPQPMFAIVNHLKSGHRVKIPDCIPPPFLSLIELLIDAENHPTVPNILQNMFTTSPFPPEFLPSPPFTTNFVFRRSIEPVVVGSVQSLMLLRQGLADVTISDFTARMRSMVDDHHGNSMPLGSCEEFDAPGPDYVFVDGKWAHLDEFD